MKLADKDKRIERPHEGPGKLQQKRGYFYHARLNDFSKSADKTKEDDYKFKYVCQGPVKAKQKKLYYVFGKGANAMAVDKGIIRSTQKKPQGKGYVWQDNFKQPNHAYFDMTFLQQDEEGIASDDEDTEVASVLADDTSDGTGHTVTKLKLHQEDTVLKVQERVGLQVLKPADHIHISLLNRELKSHEVIGDLRKPEDGKWTIYSIQLAKV
ncbi:unnamed protein product [Owenia fusiformis]|nr:unnamed protein product [Owenia fusiformis]